MKNLKLATSLCSKIEEAAGAQCVDVNFDNGTIYIATDRQLLECDPGSGTISGKLDLANVPDQTSDATFISIRHLPEEFSVCAATNKGDLLLWNVLSHEVECVGTVESGLTAMSWSPEQELVILTTGAQTLIVMTREFDPITELSLHPDNSGEAEFVQVGWGKKETQFHGSVGKQAAHVRPDEVTPALMWDDHIPRISWKADGQYFAISSIHPQTGARKVHVWTREGAHHSTSEDVNGIEQSLSWRPSGNLIATSQRRPNKHDIAFFERNGLRHGEFTLPFPVDQVKVKEVYWNNDSTILAVWCEDLADGNNVKSYVQLWTTGNYHWYLKQSLHFEGPEQKIGAMIWDPEQEYKLHIVCKNGGYFQYTWAWATTHSAGRSCDDQAIVAVIDGANVLMTPMRHMVVPPPMSAYELQLPGSVNQVVFAPPPLSNNIAVILVDNRVAIFKFTETGKSGSEVKVNAAGGNGFKRCCTFPSLQGIYSIKGLGEDCGYPLATSHFTWISEDIILFTTVATSGSPHSIIHKAQIDNEKITVIGSSAVESRIFNTAYDSCSKCLAVQLIDGTVLKYTPEDEMLLPWETTDGIEVQFPSHCSQMALCHIGGETCVLGLTQRYRFNVNNIEVASNCTSFSVHDEFLLLTTLSHTCRCITLHTKVKDLPTLSDGKAHPFDESVRRVERGSQIVISVADDTKLILQMPRGNLETIHPRALVLTAVRKHLDRLQYVEAFTIMRKHRINMNLLYDHNPEMFLQNIKLFVQQIAAVNHINLFLTDLIEEDVTVTMYTAAYERNKITSAGNGSTVEGNKVDKVCDAVREALKSISENKYMLSIITTYVRKTKPQLEEALQLVKNLRDCENDHRERNAEETLKYLLFLVDVNELYDVALGTYDFDLVLMVAEKSQKDPKEYIPFMNQLRKLETNYQRYTIDKHLKRYTKALENIVKCGPEHFSECLSLINEHKLHTVALQLYLSSTTQYKEIASCYGDLLAGKRQHEEAAIMFVKGENWESALTSFTACHQWQQVFCMTSQLNFSSEQEVETARQIADDLKTRGRHSEAAIVLEQYAKDSEEAIVTLIQGCLWDEALRMMHKYKRTDFIETDLKSHLVDSFEGHVNNLDQMKANFEKYRSRLAAVRQEKEKARLELIESGGAGNVQDADLFSDTSSATGESIQSSRYSAETSSSAYSKMSGRSIKNRRKAEHKKWRLKEGSEFEDFALIAELAKIIKYVDGLRDEMRSLVRALVMFHYDRQGEQIQRQYDNFLSLIDKSLPQIWLDEETDQEFTPVLGPNTTANTIALAMQQGKTIQTADREDKLDPVIKFAPVLQKDVKWKLYALET
ncbi:putative elongator complex protein 1 [Ruditapes philippinarum]|uniref:putative elongator complex protein 1 n=1 Tax=Ruditapes philippinarum TaxID=129788 RepID=UPI00295A6572|nr:putative elongator complex protein 1 [Ruditapes philippinarum]